MTEVIFEMGTVVLPTPTTVFPEASCCTLVTTPVTWGVAATAPPLLLCAVKVNVYWPPSGSCRPPASLPFQEKLLTPEVRLVSGPVQTACPAALEIVATPEAAEDARVYFQLADPLFSVTVPVSALIVLPIRPTPSSGRAVA